MTEKLVWLSPESLWIKPSEVESIEITEAEGGGHKLVLTLKSGMVHNWDFNNFDAAIKTARHFTETLNKNSQSLLHNIVALAAPMLLALLFVGGLIYIFRHIGSPI